MESNYVSEENKLKPTNDFMFKKIFGQKSKEKFLVALLNTLLKIL